MQMILRPHRPRSGCRSVVLGAVLSTVLFTACGTTPATSPPAGSATPAVTAAATPTGVPASAAATVEPTSGAGEASLSPTAASNYDACALTTPTELTDIVGGDIAGIDSPGGTWTASQCQWTGSTASFIVTIGTASSIGAYGDAAAPDARAMLEQYRAQEAGAETVAKVGDGAVRGENGMAAYKGDTYVEVEELILTDDQLTEIVTLIVSRL